MVSLVQRPDRQHPDDGETALSHADGVIRRRIFLALAAALPFAGTAEARPLPKSTAAVYANPYSDTY